MAAKQPTKPKRESKAKPQTKTKTKAKTESKTKSGTKSKSKPVPKPEPMEISPVPLMGKVPEHLPEPKHEKHEREPEPLELSDTVDAKGGFATPQGGGECGGELLASVILPTIRRVLEAHEIMEHLSDCEFRLEASNPKQGDTFRLYVDDYPSDMWLTCKGGRCSVRGSNRSYPGPAEAAQAICDTLLAQIRAATRK